MRYQNLKAFQKHLATAAPDHLCHCYLVILADDEERSQILKEIFPSAQQVLGVSQVLEALSPSLFEPFPKVFLDEVEKLSKEELQLLERALPPAGYLLLGSRKKVALAAAVEKEGIILDLSEEKPWDRERRLTEQLFEKVEKTGKRLASDVPALLFERVGIDAALLDQEIDKLLCFIGERSTIERSDVFRLGSTTATHTLWQMAEEIVWGDGKFPPDATTFHALLPALRSQLQLGSKLASLSSTGEDPSPYLPKIWPKTLEKRRAQVERLGSAYFQKGLKLLFEIELLSRTGSSQFAALLDLFRMGLHAR